MIKEAAGMIRRVSIVKGRTFVQFKRRFSTPARQKPSQYCLDLVRKRDYENYLCTLLLPPETCTAAFTIRAFNVEVAQVEDQVSERTIGTMRMQFWKDAVEQTFKGQPPANPVMMELSRVLQHHKLSKHYFKRLIDARAQALCNWTFLNLEAIEKYAEYAVSSLYYLILEAHRVTDMNTDHRASHLGKSQGIVTLLRSIPYNSSKRVNVLPQDILMKHNVSAESVLRREVTPAFQDCICDVASRAKLHLDTVKSLKRNGEVETELIFLPATCVEDYLVRLQQVDFNVFHPSVQERDYLMPLRLWWRKWRLR